MNIEEEEPQESTLKGTIADILMCSLWLTVVVVGYFAVTNYHTKMMGKVFEAHATAYRVTRLSYQAIDKAHADAQAIVDKTHAEATADANRAVDMVKETLDQASESMKETLEGSRAIHSYNELFKAKFNADCPAGEYTVLHEGFELKVTVWDPMPSREPGVSAVQKWQTRISRTPRQLAAQ